MSAEAGLVMNLIFFSGLWTISSVIVDKIVPIFNRTCLAVGCMQDGVNSFGMLISVWGIGLVLIWLTCLINYIVTKNNQAIANQVI
jgi:hypothetical protein